MRFLIPLLALASVACSSSPDPDEPPFLARELRVGFLIVDGVYDTELTAPFDVFQHTVFHVEPGMEVFTVAPSLEPVRTFEGLRILPDYTLTSAPPIDVLVVPSAEHSMDSDLENAALIAWVRDVGMRSQYVLSLCDGAFVLARAGLLDGKQATTFPADVGRFREMFASTVDVHEDVSFVHDEACITSVGGARSFDAALYLCELLYGEKVARRIGRGLVLDWDAGEVEHVVAR
jgi:transcriptional regulator GlxA family with amidase domain